MISPELPNRKKNRLAGFDYSIAQAYFITICTENRRQLFWKDVGAVIDRPYDINGSQNDEGRSYQKGRIFCVAEGIL